MSIKTIALGTDHAGFLCKERVKAHLETAGYTVLDYGVHSTEPCDYPDFIYPAAWAVAKGKAEGGIVFGGSGNGEAMVANKVPGIRCGLCWDVKSARLTKQHNNANVISIGARLVADDELLEIVDVWMNTSFEGGRHDIRLTKLHAGESPAGPS